MARLALVCAAFALASAGAGEAHANTVTFASTGVGETFTVPDGVTSLHAVAIGAHAGGGQFPGGDGGFGAIATADFP